MAQTRSSEKVVVLSHVGGEFKRPSQDRLAMIAGADVTAVSELVGTMYTMDGSIRPISSEAVPVCGVAITAKCPPGDNQAMIRALKEARPGDVLVVDAKGFTHWCLGGYLLLEYAQKNYGLAGLIVNGAYRDVEEIRAARFPVYCLGISPYSGPKAGPGEVNVPANCGGVVVQPGDVVLASGEGVVVVPQRSVEAVYAALSARKQTVQQDIGRFVEVIVSAFDSDLT